MILNSAWLYRLYTHAHTVFSSWRPLMTWKVMINFAEISIEFIHGFDHFGTSFIYIFFSIIEGNWKFITYNEEWSTSPNLMHNLSKFCFHLINSRIEYSNGPVFYHLLSSILRMLEHNRILASNGMVKANCIITINKCLQLMMMIECVGSKNLDEMDLISTFMFRKQITKKKAEISSKVQWSTGSSDSNGLKFFHKYKIQRRTFIIRILWTEDTIFKFQNERCHYFRYRLCCCRHSRYIPPKIIHYNQIAKRTNSWTC